MGRAVAQVLRVPGPTLPQLLAGTHTLDGERGLLRLTVQGSRVFDSPRAPQVTLNGYPVPVSYGENLVEVPAGSLTVEVHCRLLRRYGEARRDVVVPAEGSLALFYAAPHHEFGAGRLGGQPQRRAGGTVALGLGLLAVAQLVLVLTLLLR